MSSNKQMLMYGTSMVKPDLAKNRLQLHFPCQQMKLAFAQIFKLTQTTLSNSEMKHISELCLQLKTQ